MRNSYEDHALARLVTIAGQRGDLEEQLKCAREGVAVTRRVYPEGHTYRREAESVLVRVLAQQTGIFLDRAAAAAAAGGDAKAHLTTARVRLAELEPLDAKETGNLKSRLAKIEEQERPRP